MVRLRGHHLLCLLTFVGEGYTPAFTRNYLGIATRLSAGEAIEIVEGPDDICAPMLGTPDAHCDNESIRGRDEHALAATAEVLGIPLEAGSILVLDGERLGRLRAAFADGATRAACGGCEWSAFCTRVADEGFGNALINAEAAPPKRLQAERAPGRSSRRYR